MPKLNTILDIDMLIENEDKFKDFIDDRCEDCGVHRDDIKAVVNRLFERFQNQAKVLESYK